MNNLYLPEGLLYGTAANREYISSPEGLARAMREGRILEAPAAMCDSEMDLYVDLGSVRGIMPRSEVALTRDGEELKSIAVITRVGKPVCFKVTAITEEGGMTVAYLSRRAAQLECKAQHVANLCPGDILRTKITHMEPFGAFCDIGCGIVSLLPIDCISVSRIAHPADRFNAGEYIYAAVRTVDRENDRIFLTHRELLGTWEENAAAFSAGQTVSGIVRSMESYGIFVELAPNLAGLAECKEGVRVGDVASVYIKSILPERMKVKLVIVDAAEGKYPMKRKYYVDTEKCTHMDCWQYSPACCSRIVETVFER